MSGSTTITASSTTLSFGNGVSVVVNGSNDIIYCGYGVTIVVKGSHNRIYLADSDYGTIVGTDNAIALNGNSIALDVQNTGAAAVAVSMNGSGGFAYVRSGGGYTLSSAAGNGIATEANTQLDVFGSKVTVSLGTGSVLGIGGGGNDITAGVNTTVYATGTNGVFDVIHAENDVAGGTTVTGARSGIYLDANTQANLYGSGNSIAVSAGDSFGAYGGGNTIFGIGANTTIAVGNTGTVFDTLYANGAAGTGKAANGQGAGIFVQADTQANVYGGGNSIVVTAGDSVGAYGGGNTITGVGARNTIAVGNTGTVASTVVGSGAAFGGTAANGQGTGIFVQDNSRATVFGSGDGVAVGNNGAVVLVGNFDTVSAGAGTTGAVFGTNNVVNENGAGAAFNVQNTGGGTVVVNMNATGNYAGLLGGTGYVVNGNNGNVQGFYNTAFTVGGNNNAIGAVTGDTVAVFGAGNSVTAESGTAVFINSTAGASNSVRAQNDVPGGLTVDGSQTGITLVGNSTAAVSGNGNFINVGQGGTLGLYGSNNHVVGAANAVVGVTGEDNSINSLQGGTDFITGAGNVVTANNTAVYPLNGSYVTINGTVSNPDAVRAALVQTPQFINAIDHVYGEVLGRSVDADGLSQAQNLLSHGGTFDQLRSGLAHSGELQSDLASTYSALGLNAPNQQEQDAFTTLMSLAYDAPIELFQPATLLDSNSQELANTSATNLLSELPTLETLSGGRTLNLIVGDTTLPFDTTARLADFLYAVAVQKSQATSFVTKVFNEDVTWLDQIGQHELQIAQFWSDKAVLASGNSDLVTLYNAASRIALKIAAADPANRQPMTEKVRLKDHYTKVTIDPNVADPQSSAKFNDINPSLAGILEEIGVAFVNIAAAFQVPGFQYIAIAVDGAEAGKKFANGDVIGGILSLAQAAGNVADGVGASGTGTIIKTATQAVGGVYGAVRSAQNGDPLGILAGVLEAAAAAASGLGQATDDKALQNLLNQIKDGLNKLSIVTTVSDAFIHGNLASGLIQSLQYILVNIANDYQNYHQSITDAIQTADISPITLSAPKHIAFVGGFFDATISALDGELGTVKNYARDYKRDHPGDDVQYYNHEQGEQLRAWAASTGGQAVVIAHSWGADTAASVVAGGTKVATLVTLDPVSYARPDFVKVSANTGKWVDLNATGGGFTLPNTIAGAGSPWNNAPQGYAQVFKNVNLDHANIASGNVLNILLAR